MAQNESYFDEVKKEITCTICDYQFNEVKDPRILSCFHTFCKDCLEDWLREQQNGRVSCPLCRKITECPDGIDSVQPNLFCRKMVELVEFYSGNGREEFPHCSNCDESKPLKFYCSDCNCFLCDTCAMLHKNWKSFSDHRIKEVGKFECSDAQDFARRANYCLGEQHNEDEKKIKIKYFCEECSVCVCRDCVLLEHRDHDYISIEKGIEKKKGELDAKLQEVKRNRLCLNTHKTSVETRRVKVNNSIDQATNEVHRLAEHCIMLIRQHESSVTERLARERADVQGAFTKKLTSLNEKLAEIDRGLAFSEDVLVRRNLPEILNVKTIVERRLQELSNPFDFMPVLEYTDVRYIPKDVSHLKDAPGRLVSSTTAPFLSEAHGRGLTEGVKGEDCNFTVTTKDSRGTTTYSEIDKIEVEINSVLPSNIVIKTTVRDELDGHYSVHYRPTSPGEFTVSVKVSEISVKGSPFMLTVRSENRSRKKTRPKPNYLGKLPIVGSFSYTRMSSGASESLVDETSSSSLANNLRAVKLDKEKGSCPICLDSLTNPRTLLCNHSFCGPCIAEARDKHKYNKCPVCFEFQGVVKGNQPPGEMTHHLESQSVSGYEGYGTIVIEYNFQSGIQGSEHRNPGVRYQGTKRQAYLPNTDVGKEVLQLLKRAFDARLVFTIGTSGTTGLPNQIVWNGIRHKTSRRGGYGGFGYPDPDYLRQVKEDLAAKGIR
ncbi:E3 ubiquitin-protein ligase TRIM71-like isoform X2 [Stylophora pistillata]|uniref:E3 ubiquitin-protein ligase n=1 Tax=Stylophora pistillata TaxID=50429 RepID=A0A2B4S8B8_STYPI|nr:E3 ubiquitin-protein ligase TRIM71-like isoform X2 [Stylophora pistillata]PFX25339.1 E3 ubiquitin-protein ligase DTX3L [Stylophora pistillata]